MSEECTLVQATVATSIKSSSNLPYLLLYTCVQGAVQSIHYYSIVATTYAIIIFISVYKKYCIVCSGIHSNVANPSADRQMQKEILTQRHIT